LLLGKTQSVDTRLIGAKHFSAVDRNPFIACASSRTRECLKYVVR
jgi:hypothetical protein